MASRATISSAGGSKRSLFMQDKAEEINLLLMEPDVDLWKLRDLALSEGGFVNDTLRKRVWPKVVGLHKFYNMQGSNKNANNNVNNNSNNSTASMVEEQKNANGRPPRPPSAPTFEIDTSAMFENEQKQINNNNNSNNSRGITSASSTPTKKSKKRKKKGGSIDASGSSTSSPAVGDNQTKILCESMDFSQIERDVARCTWHLLTGDQRQKRHQYKNKHRKKVASLLRKKQRRLGNLINLTLVQSYNIAPSEEEKLRYYQGYHDVACIFLQALGGGNTAPSKNNASNRDPNSLDQRAIDMGLDLPSRVLSQVSHSHFRDCLRPNFIPLQTAIRLVVFPLLFTLDPEVHAHLYDCDMEPFFCLSWIITWFAHDVRDTQLVKRLYDAFLVSHPLLPVYMTVAMICHPINRQLILETDCDFASVHQCLASLPRNSSSVGWKARMDGSREYVSDEENGQVNDEGTVSTNGDDMDRSIEDTYSIVNHDDANSEQSSLLWTTTTDPTFSGSLFSGCMLPAEKVPFQVLIDTALQYMRKYPPRTLLPLANNYFNNIIQEPFDTEIVPHITLFQNPPQWSIMSTTKADWVLKQRVREMQGLSATSRKDRKMKQLAKESSSNNTAKTVATKLSDKEYIKVNKKSRPVIAAGWGPGPDDDDEDGHRRAKRRKLLILVATGVVVTISVAAVVWYKPKLLEFTTTLSSSSSSPSSQSPESLVCTEGAKATPQSVPSSSPSGHETPVAKPVPSIKTNTKIKTTKITTAPPPPPRPPSATITIPNVAPSQSPVPLHVQVPINNNVSPTVQLGSQRLPSISSLVPGAEKKNFVGFKTGQQPVISRPSKNVNGAMGPIIGLGPNESITSMLLDYMQNLPGFSALEDQVTSQPNDGTKWIEEENSSSIKMTSTPNNSLVVDSKNELVVPQVHEMLSKVNKMLQTILQGLHKHILLKVKKILGPKNSIQQQ